LLSDDGNDITQQIIENIKDNLSQNKDLANQVDADLLKYVNIDKLQKALQGTEEGLAEIIEYSIKIKEISKDTTLSQSLAMVKEVFDNMKQIIDVLQKFAIIENPSNNNTPVSTDNVVLEFLNAETKDIVTSLVSLADAKEGKITSDVLNLHSLQKLPAYAKLKDFFANNKKIALSLSKVFHNKGYYEPLIPTIEDKNGSTIDTRLFDQTYTRKGETREAAIKRANEMLNCLKDEMRQTISDRYSKPDKSFKIAVKDIKTEKIEEFFKLAGKELSKETIESLLQKENAVIGNTLQVPWEYLVDDAEKYTTEEAKNIRKQFLIDKQIDGAIVTLSVITYARQLGNSDKENEQKQATNIKYMLSLIHAGWSANNSWSNLALLKYPSTKEQEQLTEKDGFLSREEILKDWEYLRAVTELFGLQQDDAVISKLYSNGITSYETAKTQTASAERVSKEDKKTIFDFFVDQFSHVLKFMKSLSDIKVGNITEDVLKTHSLQELDIYKSLKKLLNSNLETALSLAKVFHNKGYYEPLVSAIKDTKNTTIDTRLFDISYLRQTETAEEAVKRVENLLTCLTDDMRSTIEGRYTKPDKSFKIAVKDIKADKREYFFELAGKELSKETIESLLQKEGTVIGNTLQVPWEYLVDDAEQYGTSEAQNIRKQFLIDKQIDGVIVAMVAIMSVEQLYELANSDVSAMNEKEIKKVEAAKEKLKTIDIKYVLSLIHAGWSANNSWSNLAFLKYPSTKEQEKLTEKDGFLSREEILKDGEYFEAVINALNLNNRPAIKNLSSQWKNVKEGASLFDQTSEPEASPVDVSEVSSEKQNNTELQQQQFTMDWLSDLLDFFRITEFEKRQKWINTIENPIMIIGVFIPVIQRWFIKQHKNKSPESVRQGINEILQQAGLITIDLIPTMGLIKMLTSKTVRRSLSGVHAIWNKINGTDNIIVVNIDDILNKLAIIFPTGYKFPNDFKEKVKMLMMTESRYPTDTKDIFIDRIVEKLLKEIVEMDIFNDITILKNGTGLSEISEDALKITSIKDSGIKIPEISQETVKGYASKENREKLADVVKGAIEGLGDKKVGEYLKADRKYNVTNVELKSFVQKTIHTGVKKEGLAVLDIIINIDGSIDIQFGDKWHDANRIKLGKEINSRADIEKYVRSQYEDKFAVKYYADEVEKVIRELLGEDYLSAISQTNTLSEISEDALKITSIKERGITVPEIRQGTIKGYASKENREKLADVVKGAIEGLGNKKVGEYVRYGRKYNVTNIDTESFVQKTIHIGIKKAGFDVLNITVNDDGSIDVHFATKFNDEQTLKLGKGIGSAYDIERYVRNFYDDETVVKYYVNEVEEIIIDLLTERIKNTSSFIRDQKLSDSRILFDLTQNSLLKTFFSGSIDITKIFSTTIKDFLLSIILPNDILKDLEIKPENLLMPNELIKDINGRKDKTKKIKNNIDELLRDPKIKKAMEAASFGLDNSNVFDREFLLKVFDSSIMHDAIRKYINGDKNREEKAKDFARLYGYIAFEKEFFADPANSGKTLTSDSVIEICKGHSLSLSAWIHVCDGHSPFMNGNELKGLDRYTTETTALEDAVRFEDIHNIEQIIKDPDVIIYGKKDGFGQDSIVYIKNISGKIYVYVENIGNTESSMNKAKTFFVIDEDKYKSNPILHIVEQITGIENTTTVEKDYLRQLVILVKNDIVPGKYGILNQNIKVTENQIGSYKYSKVVIAYNDMFVSSGIIFKEDEKFNYYFTDTECFRYDKEFLKWEIVPLNEVLEAVDETNSLKTIIFEYLKNKMIPHDIEINYSKLKLGDIILPDTKDGVFGVKYGQKYKFFNMEGDLVGEIRERELQNLDGGITGFIYNDGVFIVKLKDGKLQLEYRTMFQTDSHKYIYNGGLTDKTDEIIEITQNRKNNMLYKFGDMINSVPKQLYKVEYGQLFKFEGEWKVCKDKEGKNVNLSNKGTAVISVFNSHIEELQLVNMVIAQINQIQNNVFVYPVIDVVDGKDYVRDLIVLDNDKILYKNKPYQISNMQPYKQADFKAIDKNIVIMHCDGMEKGIFCAGYLYTDEGILNKQYKYIFHRGRLIIQDVNGEMVAYCKNGITNFEAGYKFLIFGKKIIIKNSKLKVLFSIFVAPFREKKEIDRIYNGEIGKEDFLIKHKDYRDGGKETRERYESRLTKLLNIMGRFAGFALMMSFTNIAIHMFLNIQALITDSVLLTKTDDYTQYLSKLNFDKESFEYNDGDVKLILLEMPDGNNYAVNIIHCGRYHMMGLEKENESAAVSGFGNALSSQDTEKLFGLKIQIRENGKWTDLTKKASQYKADKLRIIRTKNYQAKTKLSVVNPTDVSYKPAGKQLSQSQSDESQAAIKNITNTNERRTVYLEDINSDSESFENNIIQAVDNHDLLVIYPLKNNINSEQLSTGELFDAYNFILHRIGDFSRVISSLLMSKYGFKTTTQFFFAEILKNAFIHGNKLKTNLPIYIDFTGNQIKIYNSVDPKIESTQRERFVFTATGGSGFKSGINFMQIGKKSGEEQKKLMREFSLLGYSDNLDMLNYSSNPEVKSDGKVFYEAVINIDVSQPSFTDVAKTSENMRPYERMAESSNKADLAEEIFNDLIGFAYFENAGAKTEEEIHKFYNGIIVKEVNNYFNTLSLEQRKKYIDKNKEKTKELFDKDKSKIAKEIEKKVLMTKDGLEQFVRAKGYDAGKGYIQKIISDITSKGLFLSPEDIIKRVQAGEENLLRFSLLQNTVGIDGIDDELGEFVLANAGLTLEEFKEKADKEYGTINDKSWNLELKKYEQENSLSGENKLSPGEEMHEASNKAAVTEQIFENLIGSDALETEDEDLQDEMLIFFNEIIMEAVNDYFESMSVSQRRKYLDTASFDKVKGKIAKNLETEILGTYEGLEQFIKAKGYDAGQNYIQNLITNIVNGKFVMSPVEIIAKIEQKRENLLRFNMVQKTIGITGEETNNNIAKFVLQNSSLPIEEFKVKADKEFRGINEDLWNKELKKYMQIKAGMLPDLEFPEYGLSQQEISDISQIASKSKSYQEFISSVGAKYGKKTLGISRTRQGRYAKGYYNKKHDVSVEFGDCDGVTGTWAQLNDQDNGIIDYGSQDIKFHISASPENAKEIYDLVRPVLDKYNMTFKVAVNTEKLQSLKKTQVGKFITIYLPEAESLQVLVDLGLELDAVLSSYNKRNKSPEILNEIKLGSSGILTVRDEAMKRGVEIDKQTRALQFTDFFNKSKTELVKIWDTRTESKAVTAEYNTQSVKKALDKMGVILPPEYNLDKFVSGETIRLDLPPEEWAEGVAGKLKSKLGLQGIENQPVQSPKATKQVMRPEVRFELIEEIEQGLNDMGISWALGPENIDATMELITQEMLNSDKPVGDMINSVAGKLDAKRYGADEEIDFMKMFEEEFANIGKKKTDNKTSSTESLIKESINPISLITRTAVKIVTAKEISDELAEKILEDKINYDIKSNLIIIDSNEQAQKLREQGFNVASVRIADSKEIKRGKKGIVIGEIDGKQI
ncbi:MAG: hypothetical protein PHC34_11265, partial [Candidatus Gastranaerophilales bacterium]|nr:hypothetical protein [Candidatus Gastranaerophilales bacterium]